jgi:pimeloyl-ACP methyl ester carboxylesterase
MISDAPAIRFVHCRSGERVATATHGTGPTLVCPAWWVGHVERDWDGPEFRKFFSRLGEVCTVVRYDRPGVGLSSKALTEASLEHEVSILDDVVRAHGSERLSLLGISCGGPPSVRWAAEHPERVDGLVLCGTYARGSTLASERLQHALLDLVLAHWGAGARALSDVFMPDASREQRDRFTELQKIATDAASAARVLRLTYAMDVAADLAHVRAATTVIHRKRDRAIPFAAGHELALGIAGAELVPLDGRDHPIWMHDDATTIVVRALGGEARFQPGECALDADNRRLLRDGEPVELTALEFGVIEHLVHNDNRVVSRAELVETVWQQPHAGSNVVDAVVRTLRKKLGRFAPSIETVVGHGYRFQRFRAEAPRQPLPR